jgi:hypothetical protein
MRPLSRTEGARNFSPNLARFPGRIPTSGAPPPPYSAPLRGSDRGDVRKTGGDVLSTGSTVASPQKAAGPLLHAPPVAATQTSHLAQPNHLSSPLRDRAILAGTPERGTGSAQRGAGTRLRDATVEPNRRRAEILSGPLARFPGQIPTSGAPPPPCSAPRVRDVTAKACVRPRATFWRAPSRSGVASKQTALGTCSALRGILRRLLLA